MCAFLLQFSNITEFQLDFNCRQQMLLELDKSSVSDIISNVIHLLLNTYRDHLAGYTDFSASAKHSIILKYSLGH